MNKLLIILSVIFAIQTFTFGQHEAQTNDDNKVLSFEEKSWIYADSLPLYNIKASIISLLEIPKTSPKDKIITHIGYALLYNKNHEQANWVAYELTKAETNKQFDRTDKFMVDPLVKTGTANDKDYSGSGYDRGHLAPAADMGWSSAAIAESFYYSNMSPQDASFNRGIWKNLEGLVRTWAIENEAVYVVTGAVLTNGLPTIGRDKVSVPKYYYKVILDYTEPDIKGIGFILPNIGSKEPLQSFAVSIDSVESVTGIDFFPLLPDDQEKLIEKTLSINSWSWKSTSTADTKEKASTSVQCKGLTRTGNNCKNKILNVSGYCYLHQNQASGNSSETVKKTQTANPASNHTGEQTITGPRGGQYHYSKSGNKVYTKRK